MTLPPISGKVGLDTKEFQAGLAAMNRDIRVIESGFQAAAAGLGDWTKSATGLETRIAALNKEIGVQTQKVSALQKAYELTAAAQGEDSRAAEELLIKLNNETKALNKMQGELAQTDRALAELEKGSDKAGDQVQDMDKQSQGATRSLKVLKGVASGLGAALKVGIAGVVALAGAVAGLAVGIGKLVVDTANAADELVDLSAKTGISTERLQELSYIGDQIGTDLDTMTGALSRLIRSMASGSDAFKTLGVEVRDSSGNLRDSEEVFNQVITALGNIENPTERDALAMEIFGKSAMELNPLIKAGADELKRLAKEAHKMGAVMDGDSVQAAANLADQMASLKAGLIGTLRTLAGAFMPGFSALLTTAGGYVQQFARIVNSADGDMLQVARGVGMLIANIVRDIAVQAPRLLEAGLSIIQGILDAIVSNLPQLVQGAVDIIKTLLKFVIQNLPMIIEAGLQIIIALAQGIAEALPELIPMVAEIIPKIIEIILENLPALIEAAVEIIVALVDGLTEAIPILIEAAPKLMEALVKAIILSVPALLKAAWKIIEYLAKAIKDLGPNMLKIGKAILEGIWNGIQNSADEFRKKIMDIFQGLVDGIKDLLGIDSPSKVFAEMGEMSGLGYVEGLAGALKGAERKLRSSLSLAAPAIAMPGVAAQGLQAAPGRSAGGGGPGSGGLQVTINQYFPDQVRTPDQWKMDVAKIARQQAEDGLKTAMQAVRGQRRSVYGV